MPDIFFERNRVDQCEHALERDTCFNQSHSLQIALACSLVTNNESTNSQNAATAVVTFELDKNNNPRAALSTALESHTILEQKW